jgi:hypothetical protein
VIVRRGGFLENDDGGRDQGVAELNIRRTISVDVQKFDVLGQVSFDGGAVIYIHEFRWDQPDGQPARSHPGIAQQQEVGVKPGQATDIEAETVADQRFQPLFVGPVEVMMPHVRRVGQDQIIEPVGGNPREIAGNDPQAGRFPKAFGGDGNRRIDLNPAGGCDSLWRECLAAGRVKRAAADVWVEE